jgi:hypothetical protein
MHMVNLIIEIPDDLVRSLEGIAATQRKSIQQLAIECLASLVDVEAERRTGSPAAVLRAIQEPPIPVQRMSMNLTPQLRLAESCSDAPPSTATSDFQNIEGPTLCLP